MFRKSVAQLFMNVTILTEAGLKAGFGHYYRCVSIALELAKRHFAYDLYVAPHDRLPTIKSIPYTHIYDWMSNNTDTILKKTDIVIVDSYRATKKWYKAIADNKPLVVLDDTNRLSYPKCLIVNGGLGAEKIAYPNSTVHEYILGCRYTPLRNIFRHMPHRMIIRKKMQNVMVSMGGSIYASSVSEIIKKLRVSYPNIEFHGVEVTSGQIDEETLFNRMIKCDIAISAAGQTLNELIRVGLPTIAVGIVQNQRYNISSSSENGLIEFAGWYSNRDILARIKGSMTNLLPYSARINMHKKMVSIFDGHGSERIAYAIEQYYEDSFSHK